MRTSTALLTGALVGLLLTAPFTAVLYLADQVYNLPFVPYTLFDWIGRVLPGDVLTRGIDGMVTAIRELDLGETSSTAKTIENGMGLLTFLAIGAGAGAALFAVLRALDVRLNEGARYVPGVIVGAVVGLPLILISRHILYGAGAAFTNVAPEGLALLWLAIAFLGWGAALSWVYFRTYPEQRAARELIARPAEQPAAERLNRRQFIIRLGGASAAITVAGAGVGKLLAYLEEQDLQATIEARREAVENMPGDLPNAGAAVQPVPGTRPEYTPLEQHYRIDINSRPVEIDGDEWRLRIHGLVDQPAELTLDDLTTRYPSRDQYVTLACISNPLAGDLTSTTRWTGVSLRDVLADVGVQSGASYLILRSADGFHETVDLAIANDDPRVMLAYQWDGIALLPQHGYPLRIYIPDRYGMKQPKWISEIEVSGVYEEGYWVVRGWDEVAQMRAISVIDVVAAGDAYADADTDETMIPIGGIAHAGARGISKVEVRVDDGAWTEAQLREPLSETTWVIWRYDWPFTPGEHTFAVRCVEGDGTPQIEERRSTKPSGATGIHSVSRAV